LSPILCVFEPDRKIRATKKRLNFIRNLQNFHQIQPLVVMLFYGSMPKS
ncbi:hypothetical protein HMPREF0027_2176, partial [Actinobacillus ureae ATCC 25976]